MEDRAIDDPALPIFVGIFNSLSVAELNSRNEPPVIVIGRTVKKRYAGDVCRCVELMESYTTSAEMKYKLRKAGFKIHRKWDKKARDMLDEALESGDFSLKDDHDKYSLIKIMVERTI